MAGAARGGAAAHHGADTPRGYVDVVVQWRQDNARPRDDNRTMTDSTTRNGVPPSPAGAATPDPSKRFGSLKIAFGDGAVSPAAAPVAGDAATSAGAAARTSSRVLIIGSGPAGLTAAIYAARANLEPIVLGGSAPGGQLMLTSEVENYPGFPDGIDGPDLMGRMRAQAERFGTVFEDVDVEKVDFSSRPFRVWARGVEYRGQTVIIATGASALWLNLESEQRMRGRGVSACATCDGFFFRDREIAVVGGGDTAMEEANYLTRFASKVHLLHRRDAFRASKIMIDRTYHHPRIEVHTNTEVAEVLGDAKVQGLRLRDTTDGAEHELPVDGLFIAIGHKPNTDVFRDWIDVDEKGYLVAHEHTESRIEGVFIAGDVNDHRYRQAVTAAGDGCRAAIDAEHWLEAQGIEEPAAAATA